MKDVIVALLYFVNLLLILAIVNDIPDKIRREIEAITKELRFQKAYKEIDKRAQIELQNIKAEEEQRSLNENK